MFIVEWDDHEGNRHEIAFEGRKGAELEAAWLENRFDYVAIVEERVARFHPKR